MIRRRDATSSLLWLATLLLVAWGYFWMLRGHHGFGVHLLLGGAFAATLTWGLLRAR
jgi:hypothetical protein